MNKKLFAALSFSVLLVACSTAKEEAMETTNDSMMEASSAAMMDDTTMEHSDAAMMMDDSKMEGSEDAMMKKDEAIMKKAAYSAYSPAVLTDGQTKVLFFHAAWCPACRTADTTLQAMFSTVSPTVNVYKVDYDTSAELKAKYGVTSQHTFVVVDGQGNAVKTVQGPTDEVLKGLIGA